MWFGVVTLFPDMFQLLENGITGRALKNRLIELATWNPRDFTTNLHHTVDDKPFGGGPGMLMMPEPLSQAIQAAKHAAPKPPLTVYLSPQGKRFEQADIAHFLQRQACIFIAGRYEGIDERIIEQEVDEEWSLGDFVLSGGEFAALAMIDAITRTIPGAVNAEDSITQDSLSSGLLKYPQYTRPHHFAGLSVPDVLVQGDHAAIRKWRLKASLGRTWLRRPDILAKKLLNEEEKDLLDEFISEYLQ